jgi:uncharacterized integral membrane protein
MVKTPLAPLKPNHKTQTMFIGIFLLIYFGLFFILFPSNLIFSLTEFIADHHWYFPLIILVLGVITLALLMVASVQDPG